MDKKEDLFILLVNYESPNLNDSYLAVLSDKDGWNNPQDDVLIFNSIKDAVNYAENKIKIPILNYEIYKRIKQNKI